MEVVESPGADLANKGMANKGMANKGMMNNLSEPGYGLWAADGVLVCQPAHDGYHWGECQIGELGDVIYTTPEGARRFTALRPTTWFHFREGEAACSPGLRLQSR